MKKLVVLAALVLAGALIAHSNAVASDTICVGIVSGTHDNIVVPPGAVCSVFLATVLGNIKALEKSKLVVIVSAVHGNVEGDKADLVQVFGSTVRENILIREGGPAAAPLPAGFAPCAGSPCEVFVSGSTVSEGDVQIEKMVGSVFVVLSTIEKGNVKTEDNFIPIGEFLALSFNPMIAQNLQVFKNTGLGGKSVAGNKVGEAIQCEENSLPFGSAFNTAPVEEGQCPPLP